MIRYSALVLLFVVLFNVSYALFTPNEGSPLKSNLLVFFLFYVGVFFISVLAFIIGRNIVKLVFDRRNRILGAKLRTRLVVAFAGMAVVTSIILFVFAGGLLSNVLKAFFSVQIEDAMQGAVDIAKIQYTILKNQSDISTKKIIPKIKNLDFTSLLDRNANEQVLETERLQYRLYSVSVLDEAGTLVAFARNAAAAIETFEEPEFDSKAIEKTHRGQSVELFEENSAQNFIRHYEPFLAAGKHQCTLITTLRIDTELSDAMGRVNDIYREYSQTKLFKSTLRSGYLLTLLLITGVTLFASVWFGFYLSKQLTIPIQQLALATNRVAKGDYETQIDVSGDDELSFLASSFNQMISELKTTRDEAGRRGAFIETILARLGVAVVALDHHEYVTQINEACEKLFFSGTNSKPIFPKKLDDVLPKEVVEVVRPLLAWIKDEQSDTIREAELLVSVSTDTHTHDEKKLVCTVGALNDNSGTRVGSVILFDDITEITKAQSMAVWREVARRIAHEIKNPLTPIRLSAQRLQKLLKTSEHSETILELAETIVQNVDNIKTLANEFSNFARMPTLETKECSLDAICRDVLQLYSNTGVEVNLQYLPDQKIPVMVIDPDQIRRVLINLFDNAIDALKNLSDEAKVIQLKTEYDPKNSTVNIEVADNGQGIPMHERIRVFEPYYTTKKEGTGLGLGIVLSIISDHQGTIRIVDNKPRGIRFVISLPVSALAPTQRRLAGTA